MTSTGRTESTAADGTNVEVLLSSNSSLSSEVLFAMHAYEVHR